MKSLNIAPALGDAAKAPSDLSEANIVLLTEDTDPIESFFQKVAADPKKIHVVLFDLDDE